MKNGIEIDAVYLDEMPNWVRLALPERPRLFAEMKPIIISEPFFEPGQKERFIQAMCDAFDQPKVARFRPMYPVPTRATFVDLQECGKPYRVFYDCGVYEWYINDGRKPYHWYAKHGVLIGAFNIRANKCAKIS